MKFAAQVIAVLAISVSTSASAEILEVTGPSRSPASGSSHTVIRFSFPTTAVGSCVQNNGLGEFVDARNEPLVPDGTEFGLHYRCAVPVTSRNELNASGVAVDQLGAVTSSRSGFPETDPGSKRFLLFREEGAFRMETKAFRLGANMASFYYRGSELGADGYYYVVDLRCDPWRVNRVGITEEELRSVCTAATVLDFARTATAGGDSISAVAIDSPYL